MVPQQQYERGRNTKPLAIATFVLSLVMLLFSITPFALFTWVIGAVSAVLAIVALVLSAGQQARGEGFAVAGIVLGLVSVLLSILMASVYYGDHSIDSPSASPAPSPRSSAGSSSSASSSSAAQQKGFDAASYTSASYEDVARDPDAYENKKLMFSGSVLQLMEGSANEMRLAVDGDHSDIVYVTYDPSLVDKRILEGDTIRMYGVCSGLYDYTSIFGKQVNVPGMRADRIEQVTEEEKAQQAAAQYGVTIDSYALSADFDGQPIMIVSLTFANNSSETASFSSALDTQAFQNGVELESAYPVLEPSYDGTSAHKDVKPGGTIAVQQAFALSGSGSVAVEVRSRSFIEEGALIAESTFSV